MEDSFGEGHCSRACSSATSGGASWCYQFEEQEGDPTCLSFVQANLSLFWVHTVKLYEEQTLTDQREARVPLEQSPC